ncbi:STAS domain-containing protein [Ruminococcus sp. FC2018]|uniref:STAS domain-containing protein n=1 Tax=Ruminococcus sp. FC2018 TaxID=1410617 RepID=UPI00048CBBB0|nr:STAS domain-containing protein [Ruminococcus sp. FC2018]
MTINKESKGSKLTMAIQGRVDTTTAPELDKQLRESIDGVTDLILDFTKVEYVSSAGLRVLLSAQKIMNKQGQMKLIGVSDDIKEIFDITGFSEILTFE